MADGMFRHGFNLVLTVLALQLLSAAGIEVIG